MPWPFDVAGQVYVSMAVFLSLSFYKLSMISLYLFGVYAGLICFKCASKINTILVWTDVRINMANNFIFCNIFCLLSWRSSCRPRCFWTFLLLLALVWGGWGVVGHANVSVSCTHVGFYGMHASWGGLCHKADTQMEAYACWTSTIEYSNTFLCGIACLVLYWILYFFR